MNRYAEHLEGVDEILAAARQVAGLASDLAGTPTLATVPGAADRRKAHAAFAKAYGDATVGGIPDEADARDLLRDAVNVALGLAHAYAVNGGGDRVLIGRACEVRDEFKPGFDRHYGLGLGDRVAMRGMGASSVTGEVVRLHPTDNNRATVIDDADGEEVSVVGEWCDQVPTFLSRPSRPAPSPR